MATKVVMEALSPTMEEGRVAAWKKKEGDTVKAGEVLAEVETDKAVMDLVARGDGVLRQVTAQEGETLPVGSQLAVIAAAGEDVGAAPKAETGDRRPETEQAKAPSAPPSTPAPPVPSPVSGPQSPPSGDRVLASPLARRIATEKGVDLGSITGSGPAGRVVKRDVESAKPGAVSGPRPLSPFPAVSSGAKDVPLTQIRKTIARRLAQSIGPIPHFFLTSEIDMERAWDLRGELKAKGDQFAVSFNDIVIKAVAHALRRHQPVNAWWMDDHIRYHGDVHIGMAVAVEDGLITPVIRFADQKGLQAISAEAKALAEKARHRRLLPEEYTGATFSVSNLGMLDIDEFTAVINPPEAGILAVGRIAQKPVALEGEVALRRMMRVTMSCDHRVIDGATGAQFLQTVKLNLENPLAMLL